MRAEENARRRAADEEVRRYAAEECLRRAEENARRRKAAAEVERFGRQEFLRRKAAEEQAALLECLQRAEEEAACLQRMEERAARLRAEEEARHEADEEGKNACEYQSDSVVDSKNAYEYQSDCVVESRNAYEYQPDGVVESQNAYKYQSDDEIIREHIEDFMVRLRAIKTKARPADSRVPSWARPTHWAEEEGKFKLDEANIDHQNGPDEVYEESGNKIDVKKSKRSFNDFGKKVKDNAKKLTFGRSPWRQKQKGYKRARGDQGSCREADHRRPRVIPVDISDSDSSAI